MAKAAGAFDPILRIGDLELNLSKANDRIKELEYLLAQLNEHKSSGASAGGSGGGSGGAAADMKRLIEENVRLKSEVKKLSETKQKNTALLFSMGREHASATARLAKKASVSVTMKRLQYRAHEVQILQDELVRWLNGLLSGSGGVLTTPLTTQSLLETLSTGSVLCALIKRINPKYALGKVHEKAPPGSFFCHDNVKAFLGACTAMGVPAHALFETNDLVGSTKNTRAVVHCILSLAKVAAGPPYNIPPPDIVRIDMELDELESKKPAAAATATVDAAKAAEKEANRAKEEAEVAKAIAEMCKTYGVAPPTKLKGNLYTFLNTVPDAKEKTINAYVRMLRGTPLIRLNDGWEELSAYMIQIAQTHGVVETAEEQAIKQRIDEATHSITAELISIKAHRDTLANQVTELQTAAAAAASGGKTADAKSIPADQFEARVTADVAKATADLREQLLRVIEERDRKAQDSTELAQLRTTLLAVQSERDVLTGKLIDAQSRVATTSGDAAAVKSELEKTLADMKEQLLAAVKARDSAAAERAETNGRYQSLEQKFTALQKQFSDEQKKSADAVAKATAATAAAAAAEQKSKSPAGGKKGGRASVGFAGDAAGAEEDDTPIENLSPEEKEKRKRREDEAAYREFFYLTALSVKMNHNATGDAIELAATSNANSTDLYERARANEVPFHQFHKWIEREITMAYLLASNQARAEYNAGGAAAHHKQDLRSLRASRQTVVNSRPHTNPIVADKEPSGGFLSSFF